MIAGLYNQTLTLERRTNAADGQGGTVPTWASAGTFRGRVSTLRADEKQIQNKESMTSTHKIFCAPMNVLPDDRIKWGSFYFEITGINNPSESYHHLEIYVLEVSYT